MNWITQYLASLLEVIIEPNPVVTIIQVVSQVMKFIFGWL